MKFEKCHGLGNDYIYVDAKELTLEAAGELAITICPRASAVGADGIILLGKLSENRVSMRMVNADGSEGMICGNGLRCVAFLAKRWGWVTGERLSIETAVGERAALIKEYSDQEALVQVEMGHCQFEDSFELEGPQGGWQWQAVSMGNPHVVCLMADNFLLEDLDFQKWGPKISNHEKFPGGVNANFLFKTGEGKLLSRIWERGSGATYACGSGACAGFAVARNKGWVGDAAEVALELGTLTMTWDEDKGILMTGPATWVYSGEI